MQCVSIQHLCFFVEMFTQDFSIWRMIVKQVEERNIFMSFFWMDGEDLALCSVSPRWKVGGKQWVVSFFPQKQENALRSRPRSFDRHTSACAPSRLRAHAAAERCTAASHLSASNWHRYLTTHTHSTWHWHTRKMQMEARSCTRS